MHAFAIVYRRSTAGLVAAAALALGACATTGPGAPHRGRAPQQPLARLTVPQT